MYPTKSDSRVEKERASTRQPINWEAIRQQMAEVWQAFAAELAPSTEQTAMLLQARAKMLAQEDVQPETNSDAIEVVEFRLAHETYGIESCYVQAVVPLKELTPLPCTPPFVSGIVNVRGQVRSVVDLKRILELPETGATHQQTILILHSETMEFGILVDAVLGVHRLAADAGRLSAFTFTERRSEFLKGVTMEQVVILDGETLLSNPGLIVYEEMIP